MFIMKVHLRLNCNTTSYAAKHQNLPRITYIELEHGVIWASTTKELD